jgi:hypothetical protein
MPRGSAHPDVDAGKAKRRGALKAGGLAGVALLLPTFFLPTLINSHHCGNCDHAIKLPHSKRQL